MGGDNRNKEDETVRRQINDVLDNNRQCPGRGTDKPTEDLLQEISIYHQELEYQNLELRRVQQELEISREHYASLFHKAPVPYVVLDKEHRIQSVNDAFLQLMETTKEDSVSTPFEKWVDKDSQNEVYLYFRSLEKEDSVSAIPIQVSTSSGVKTVRIQSNRLVDEQEAAIRISLVDFSTEKKMEEMLKQHSRELEEARCRAETANVAKTQFLATISHELRTPMNGVYGFLQLMQDTPLSAEQQEYMEHMMSGSRRMLRLINHLLEFSGMEGNELQLREQDLVPKEFIKLITDSWKSQASEKGLKLVLQVPDELPLVVRGDGGRLRQVLDNLMENAVKFTESGGITVAVNRFRETDDRIWLVFQVRDTGIGIHATDQDRIFEWFTQADNSNARRYEGAGIGLTISRRLVEFMGGEMKLNSLPGKGSEFLVWLPFGKLTNEELAELME